MRVCVRGCHWIMQYDVWVGLQTAGSHVIALFQWNYLMSGEHFRKAISKRKAIKFHLLLHRRIAEFARMIAFERKLSASSDWKARIKNPSSAVRLCGKQAHFLCDADCLKDFFWLHLALGGNEKVLLNLALASTHPSFYERKLKQQKSIKKFQWQTMLVEGKRKTINRLTRFVLCGGRIC